MTNRGQVLHALLPALKRNLSLPFPYGFLRPLVPDDVYEGHAQGLNDPDVNGYLVAVRQQRQTSDTVRDFVRANDAASDSMLFGIWVDGRTTYCGTVRLHQINGNIGTGILGICIFDKGIWGSSVGSSAIDAVTRWAFDHLGLDAIEAGAYVENVASWKAFVKAGYAIIEDVSGLYELDGRPTVVRRLIARRSMSNAALLSRQLP